MSESTPPTEKPVLKQIPVLRGAEKMDPGNKFVYQSQARMFSLWHHLATVGRVPGLLVVTDDRTEHGRVVSLDIKPRENADIFKCLFEKF